LLVVLAFGFDEYTAGLRIINKHGELSNGHSISDFWMGVWGALLFLSVAVPMLPLVVFWSLTDRANSKSGRLVSNSPKPQPGPKLPS
jgi:hypothetical protein